MFEGPEGNELDDLTCDETMALIEECDVLMKCGYEVNDLVVVRPPPGKKPQFIPRSFFHDQQ